VDFAGHLGACQGHNNLTELRMAKKKSVMSPATKAKIRVATLKRWKSAKSIVAKRAWDIRKEKGAEKCKEILNQPISIVKVDVEERLAVVRKMSKDQLMAEHGSVPYRSMDATEPDYQKVVESEMLDASGWPDRFEAIEATDAPRNIKIESFDKLIENFRAAIYKTFPQLHPNYKEPVKEFDPFNLFCCRFLVKTDFE